MYFFFFYPVGTESRPRFLPWGTILIMALLAGAFVAGQVRPDIHRALLHASFRASDPNLQAAFLSLFLHADWVHLISNGIYIWIFGRQLEAALGFASWAVLFLIGGMASCWAHVLALPVESPYRAIPLVGASGGVAAILGATLVRFPHRRVRIAWIVLGLIGGMNRGGVTYVNAVAALAAWFVLQILHGLVAQEGGGAGVAYAAHAGGFCGGVVLAILMGLPRGVRKEIHRDRGQRYFDRADWYAACGELTQHLRIVPGDEQARRMRARCLVLLGRAGEAASEYLGLFKRARRGEDIDAQDSLYREMRTYAVGSNLGERALLRLAFDFQRAGRTAAACEVYRELCSRLPAGDISDLASIRLAELLWSELGRVDEARECYRRLLESRESGEWRALAEARLRSMTALAGERGPAYVSSSRKTAPDSRKTSGRP